MISATRSATINTCDYVVFNCGASIPARTATKTDFTATGRG